MTVRLLLLFASIAMIGADEPTKKAAATVAPLRGTWTMVRMENRGVRTPGEELGRYQLTIDDRQWTIWNGNIVAFKARFQIDPSPSPKTIDFFYRAVTGEALSRGIYKLEGDTLTVARTELGNARPKEFKTTSEAGMLMVWKKAKP